MVLVNRAVNAIIHRLKPKTFRGGKLLYLTTTGRTSGKPRTTPLLYIPDGDDQWVVVASNGGADWEPGWWLNLRAGSGATMEVDDRTLAVTGREADGEERAQLWRRLNDVFEFESYQRKVSRRIAVVVLTPAAV
jgi:deazaflavin-dependent oxidoreductase (nitroreductase family)